MDLPEGLEEGSAADSLHSRQKFLCRADNGASVAGALPRRSLHRIRKNRSRKICGRDLVIGNFTPDEYFDGRISADAVALCQGGVLQHSPDSFARINIAKTKHGKEEINTCSSRICIEYFSLCLTA